MISVIFENVGSCLNILICSLVELSPPAYIVAAIADFLSTTPKVGLTIMFGVTGDLTERSGDRVILTDGGGVFLCDPDMFLVSRPAVRANSDTSDLFGVG